MDELPPTWKLHLSETGRWARISIGDNLVGQWFAIEDARRIVAAVNATADPAILALAEHLNAMDPGQRGAALDQIKHTIGGEW